MVIKVNTNSIPAHLETLIGKQATQAIKDLRDVFPGCKITITK